VALPRGKHAIQLHSLGTPNGVKCTVLLEELVEAYPGFDYDAWLVKISGEQFGSGFVGANPNSKIPAMLHYSGDDAAPPVRVFESACILLYLCESFDADRKFFPSSDPRRKAECLNWLFWQMGSAPYLGGGFGHFYNYAPVKIKYAIDRFSMETKRQLDVLERHLGASDGKSVNGCEGGPYMLGAEYSIADIAIWPWYTHPSLALALVLALVIRWPLSSLNTPFVCFLPLPWYMSSPHLFVLIVCFDGALLVCLPVCQCSPRAVHWC